MKKDYSWHELIERIRNFHGDCEPFLKWAYENEPFCVELQGLSMYIDADIQKLRGMSPEKKLKMIFSRVYNFAVNSNDHYLIFGNDTGYHDDVFNACFFTSLSMFLHHTKKLKGMSLRDFLYYHSPYKYYDKNSMYYSI